MIIDSHAHYSRRNFDERFRYISYKNDKYVVNEGTREDVLRSVTQSGISGIIEPGVELESNKTLLSLSRSNPGFVFPAVGVHPTRVFDLKWSDRKTIRSYAAEKDVVAIGETGLDYHFKRADQHRARQFFWFLFQIGLAHKRKLPLVLHIRNAYPDALRVLEMNKRRLRGGVAHCFCGTAEDAKRLCALGFYIGIGGALLHSGKAAQMLEDAVRAIPLDRILVETDAPYVMPDIYEDTKIKDKKRKIRNTSLILPRVINRVAELKNVSPASAEETIYVNTLRCFGIRVNMPD